jgi:competence protein ComEA
MTLGMPLELNRSQVADLIALPGIGPVLASRIVAERTRKGAFCTLRDLQRVRGIGPALLRRLEPHLEALPPCPDVASSPE